MFDYVLTARTRAAIRAGLAHAAPGEVEEFDTEFGAAAGTEQELVLNRWWGRVHLRLNPPTAAELTLMQRVARGEFPE